MSVYSEDFCLVPLALCICFRISAVLTALMLKAKDFWDATNCRFMHLYEII
jgi:hypothetical protein